MNERYAKLEECEEIKKVNVDEINLGNGVVTIGVELQDSLFYNTLTEITGVEIKNEGELFSCITELASAQKEYNKLAYALHEVNEKGYGI